MGWRAFGRKRHFWHCLCRESSKVALTDGGTPLRWSVLFDGCDSVWWIGKFCQLQVVTSTGQERTKLLHCGVGSLTKRSLVCGPFNLGMFEITALLLGCYCCGTQQCFGYVVE